MIVFLFARGATPRSLVRAIFAGAAFTLMAFLIVRLIVRPLLNFWLRPSADSSGGLFHLTASETIVASVPARRRTRWSWKPGSLALTNRRLWFFPAEFNDEPWFLPLDDVADIVPERPLFAELAPIRNWPEHLRVALVPARMPFSRSPNRTRCLPGSTFPRGERARHYRRPAPATQQECLMSDRFTVLIADFLDETSIESAILGDIARIVIARARDEAELADHLPLADAILLFHDISILGERSFACAPRCRCVVSRRRRLQQYRPRGGHSARRDRL